MAEITRWRGGCIGAHVSVCLRGGGIINASVAFFMLWRRSASSLQRSCGVSNFRRGRMAVLVMGVLNSIPKW